MATKELPKDDSYTPAKEPTGPPQPPEGKIAVVNGEWVYTGEAFDPPTYDGNPVFPFRYNHSDGRVFEQASSTGNLHLYRQS